MKTEFIRGFFNVHAAKHGIDTIFIGHDQSVNWSVFMNGEWEPIVDAGTLKEAKTLGHSQFDKGEECPLNLDWSPVEATRGTIANTCPECGNPATDDNENALSCPDCGWEHRYTTEENEDLKARHKRAARELTGC